ncbi:hypothetical protein TrLO_g10649 [Triparma laevis f. longispina]|uniref:PH domain-containing protein n=1 Tax=Triparma laevis f. longispina TaxID=1714387 RepID=A0A9W7AGM8_9STRA|nr:hypothetical protein TrLO_g10649 [Triparma laevis f. longispina]
MTKSDADPDVLMSGWLHKDRYLSLLPDSHNYFLLTSDYLQYYSESGHGSTTREYLRGTIHFDDIVDVSQDSTSFSVVTWYRCYELKAESAEEAEKWVLAVREARGGKMDVDGERRESVKRDVAGGRGGKPWLVDEVWLDESSPIPLTQHAVVGEDLKGNHAVHVKVADGHVFTVRDLEVDGPPKDVAVTGERSLKASLRTKFDHTKNNSKKSNTIMKFLKQPSNLAFLGAAFALFLVEAFPAIFSDSAGKISVLIVCYVLGRYMIPLKDAVVSRVEVVLSSTEVVHRPKPKQHKEREKRMPRRNPIYERRLSYTDAQAKNNSPMKGGGRDMAALVKGRNILEEGLPHPGDSDDETVGAPVNAHPESKVNPDMVNFSGNFVLDLHGSSDPTEMLTAMGVPWIARKAISKTVRTLIIDHSGLQWTETIVAPMITKTMKMNLDGTPAMEVSPVDKSTIKNVTTVTHDGKKVISVNTYPDATKSQVISRELVEEGSKYVVVNRLSMGDKVIETTSRFNRIEPKKK